ncbi:MAG: 2-amino-4-hydroxy-6-hydroxymethyldihydropteridine diphosphokinase [Methylomonas sp.]|nr:2-amino-4-hydroxy-6-hydroxymethyldihydropteridine diphosphokinase [Methylomonas sp.]PPD21437.1 MAG: 2-amino-4-hydroxy-6-hydroxymethyldihydropteridine diphosphokinase [Methylomonas sp.]PPD26034.1 MAG: 2-amino-4-hydroxy-6-hydroxymethyldihydropteridine diphosphokinase [Methylomonas sp.]PPD37754.1 MAG: 2-amino-4-hydroxy-6-hydroxymethyldihydropteridine diphosphokinase [Methylomonas sp.]PPD41438.1 MAG: 2-amino-4-hydroxy-6-hydroxymethyldihydropteridine diphosphokinase [Methylomonas sp.]
MPAGYISIGSNIDKANNIRSSINALQAVFGSIALSSIYETDAVGFMGESFYNLVVRFQSSLPAKQVAKQLKQIELEHGRHHHSQKFSPRTLDLDLILYGDEIIDEGRLQIPRDDIERYAFVLEPLTEIAGTEKHPVSGKTYAELWEAFDKTGLKRMKFNPDKLSGK